MVELIFGLNREHGTTLVLVTHNFELAGRCQRDPAAEERRRGFRRNRHRSAPALTAMRFILTMAWRDSRASRRRLLLYSLSVVLGIAALVSIGSFSANVRSAIQSEAKGLLGADLFVTSSAPLTAPVLEYLGALGGEIARERTFTSMMSFPATHRLRLVQVHAIEGAFPFYGKFETDPPGRRERLAGPDPVAIVEAHAPRPVWGRDRRPGEARDDPFHGGGSAEEGPGRVAGGLDDGPAGLRSAFDPGRDGPGGQRGARALPGDGPAARRPRSRRGGARHEGEVPGAAPLLRDGRGAPAQPRPGAGARTWILFSASS